MCVCVAIRDCLYVILFWTWLLLISFYFDNTVPVIWSFRFGSLNITTSLTCRFFFCDRFVVTRSSILQFVLFCFIYFFYFYLCCNILLLFRLELVFVFVTFAHTEKNIYIYSSMIKILSCYFSHSYDTQKKPNITDSIYR